jgi:hypothetical protein
VKSTLELVLAARLVKQKKFSPRRRDAISAVSPDKSGQVKQGRRHLLVRRNRHDARVDYFWCFVPEGRGPSRKTTSSGRWRRRRHHARARWCHHRT